MQSIISLTTILPEGSRFGHQGRFAFHELAQPYVCYLQVLKRLLVASYPFFAYVR